MARQLDDEKRTNILNAASEIFGEYGYSSTTVKQIAEKAGLAPGTVYTYFDNKDELFAAVVQAIWIRFAEGMKNLDLDGSSFFEQLTGFMDFGFGLLAEVHPLLRGMFSEANKRELLIERVDNVCDTISGFFDQAFSMGILFGPVNDPEIRRFNLGIIISGILFRSSLTAPDKLQDELDMIKKNLMRGIRERMDDIARSSSDSATDIIAVLNGGGDA